MRPATGAAGALVFALSFGGTHALAAGDTTYGRIEGAVEISPGLGATLASYGARPTFELRGRYLSMAGAFLTYEEGFAKTLDPRRVVATGVEVRPLFFARWLRGQEIGQATLDLFIDSFSLELGAFFAEPSGQRFGARMGLQAGFGLELPLFGHAEGLFLTAHGGGRFSDQWASSEPAPSAIERAAFVTFGLAWHELIEVGLTP